MNANEPLKPVEDSDSPDVVELPRERIAAECWTVSWTIPCPMDGRPLRYYATGDSKESARRMLAKEPNAIIWHCKSDG